MGGEEGFADGAGGGIPLAAQVQCVVQRERQVVQGDAGGRARNPAGPGGTGPEGSEAGRWVAACGTWETPQPPDRPSPVQWTWHLLQSDGTLCAWVSSGLSLLLPGSTRLLAVRLPRSFSRQHGAVFDYCGSLISLPSESTRPPNLFFFYKMVLAL